MKLLYPSILSLFFVCSLNAQLTQLNHAPAAGEQYSTWDCDSVSPGGSGASVLWDFSTVKTYSSSLKVHIASAVTSATYANANIAVGSSITDVAYYKSSTSDLLFYGGNLPIPNYSISINYTGTPAVYASYPMSLNTTSSSAISGSINVTVPTAVSGPFTGNSMVVADGAGTVSLPGGVTYTDVIRVVKTQTINATILIPITVTQELYDYYAAGIKAPIFSIATTTFAPSFGSPTTQTLVTRNVGANGTVTTSVNQNKLENAKVNVFPNPATSLVTIEATGMDASRVLISDLTGKLINTVNFCEGKAHVDASEFPKGIYLYTILGRENNTLDRGKIMVSE